MFGCRSMRCFWQEKEENNLSTENFVQNYMNYQQTNKQLTTLLNKIYKIMTSNK